MIVFVISSMPTTCIIFDQSSFFYPPYVILPPFLMPLPIVNFCKKKVVISKSSLKDEYNPIAMIVIKLPWLQQLLKKLHI
ncbi:hypothetical protein CR513_16905, partial [Mucuna pruriens]